MGLAKTRPVARPGGSRFLSGWRKARYGFSLFRWPSQHRPGVTWEPAARATVPATSHDAGRHPRHDRPSKPRLLGLVAVIAQNRINGSSDMATTNASAAARCSNQFQHGTAKGSRRRQAKRPQMAMASPLPSTGRKSNWRPTAAGASSARRQAAAWLASSPTFPGRRYRR